MCILFHLVVRAYYFTREGRGQGARALLPIDGVSVKLYLRKTKTNKKKKKKTLHNIVEFIIDFDYPYHNPEGEGTLRFLCASGNSENHPIGMNHSTNLKVPFHSDFRTHSSHEPRALHLQIIINVSYRSRIDKKLSYELLPGQYGKHRLLLWLCFTAL